MVTTQFLLLTVFLAGSAPLVWQDVRDLAVSSWWLLLVLVAWAGAAWGLSSSWMACAALSAGVLTLGAGFLLVFPAALGEADIVYMAALAWLLPVWSFVFAVALACVFGLFAFSWLSRWGRRDVRDWPLPFLPCLALGGLAILGAAA